MTPYYHAHAHKSVLTHLSLLSLALPALIRAAPLDSIAHGRRSWQLFQEEDVLGPGENATDHAFFILPADHFGASFRIPARQSGVLGSFAAANGQDGDAEDSVEAIIERIFAYTGMLNQVHDPNRARGLPEGYHDIMENHFKFERRQQTSDEFATFERPTLGGGATQDAGTAIATTTSAAEVTPTDDGSIPEGGSTATAIADDSTATPTGDVSIPAVGETLIPTGTELSSDAVESTVFIFSDYTDEGATPADASTVSLVDAVSTLSAEEATLTAIQTDAAGSVTAETSAGEAPVTAVAPVETSSATAEAYTATLAPAEATSVALREPAAQTQRARTDPARNKNKYGAQSQRGGGLGLTGDLQSPVSQPNPDSGEDCVGAFTYTHRVGGEGGTVPGFLRRYRGVLDARDLSQGNIGNCGFGAAVLSLLYSGRSALVKNSLRYNAPELTATFKFRWSKYFFPGRHVVKIDDQLPMNGCSKYLSFAPCDDYYKTCRCSIAKADGEAASGECTSLSRIPNPYFHIPLLEKAFAKVADRYPVMWRHEDTRKLGYTGYGGMEGVPAHTVLMAFTQNIPRYARSSVAQIRACLTSNTACVLSTRDKPFGWTKNTLSSGSAYYQNVLPNVGVLAASPTGINAETKKEEFYSFVAVDTRFQTASVFVFSHYYALSIEESDADRNVVTVRNPWGHQALGVTDATLEDARYGGAIKLDINVAAAAFYTVEWTAG